MPDVPRERLSLPTARRIALAAQGFADPVPAGTPDRRHLRRVLSRTNLLQIDSVNVFQRAHYLPAFSRLGPYPMSLVDDLAYKHRELFEYWGHEASLLPVALHPLLRWRMERARNLEGGWGGPLRAMRDKPEFVAEVLRLVRERGPVGAGDIREGERNKGAWWSWDDTKVALEYLFWSGQVTTAGRRSFERLYDVPERVLPAEVLNAPTPSREDAQRELVRMSARAHGVATERDLRDYFRLGVHDARVAVASLVEAGELLPVEVEGWRQQAYLWPGAAVPRRVRRSALLSPFDPLVWERSRTERLFGFSYRIEIYVPAAKRVHGYYVLPFLHDERLAARVDLKADRKAGVLRVLASWLEPGSDAVDVATALAAELRRAADWQGLGEVVVEHRGTLAATLHEVARCGP
ncbi:MAG: winged helix-turn-helix domain-containing protein [Actinobacteria bacterium]|nr:winged helix-turn-helix domain-containing protein [Actinomycetota bacterium]MCA1721125.1 winged helix-turn-helix domain-containing protein [Actinomycetota bacterium]